ncbi:MAG: hypothetical protein R2809_10475 [Flavobacteriales bacterium]
MSLFLNDEIQLAVNGVEIVAMKLNTAAFAIKTVKVYLDRPQKYPTTISIHYMEQRDYIQSQIDQLGKVLARIVSDFLGLKSKNNIKSEVNKTNERFQLELDIDIEKISGFNSEETMSYLLSLNLNAEHVEVLSLYFLETGKLDEASVSRRIKLLKAIQLLDIADEMTSTISFDRLAKKNEINLILKEDE